MKQMMDDGELQGGRMVEHILYVARNIRRSENLRTKGLKMLHVTILQMKSKG